MKKIRVLDNSCGLDDYEIGEIIEMYSLDEIEEKETKGELWDGKMYVFDSRISVPINHKDPKVIGKDWFDGTPCERYVNCANPTCNRQILASEENQDKHLGGCCYDCAANENNRYVIQHHISEEERQKRLAAILNESAAVSL